MNLSEQVINGRRFRIVVQEWAGVEWIAANARDEAVRQMVRELALAELDAAPLSRRAGSDD